MPTLHLLGTGAAFSDAHRTTTMLAVESGGRTLVVDCGGDVVQRMLVSGLGPDSIDAMVVTHEHADHVSGFPLFIEKIWLAGRRRPIPVLGIEPAIAQARRAWESFDTATWKDVPEIQWRAFDHHPGAEVLRDERWTVTAAPGIHSVPVVGLRVEAEGRVLAYSCDTEKSAEITKMSRGAHVLVHEATGAFAAHTSNEDAARVAAEAGAGRLLLVHLPPGVRDADLAEARTIFPNTEFGEDGGRYEI